MSHFDYAAYYGPILPLADALREDEARCWRNGTEPDKTEHDYVLYLGCNVLRTVNLAETIVAILRAMQIDFVALGGPANCCGIIHTGNGDATAGTAMLDRTLDRFAGYKPKAVLNYCPSCQSRMDGALAAHEVETSLPYQHVIEFIATHLDRVEIVRPVPRRVYLHAHGVGRNAQNDDAAVRRILAAIPGLDVVGDPAEGDWGGHCSTAQIVRVGKDRFDALANGLFAAAKAAGADAVVATYHSCYRSLCRKESVHALPILHYSDLLAEAMGLRRYEHTFKVLALAADPAAAIAALARKAGARGVDQARLASAVESSFGRGPS
jgi:glycolate oxidase iron-sulfur subunit